MVGDDTASQQAFRESGGDLVHRPSRPDDVANTVLFLSNGTAPS